MSTNLTILTHVSWWTVQTTFAHVYLFSVYLVSTAYVKKNSKDIWSEEEVAEGCQYEDDNDPRPQPE